MRRYFLTILYKTVTQLRQWRLLPLRSTPLGTSHTSERPFHFSKQSAKPFFGIAIKCLVAFSLISSAVWNLLPFSGDFGFGENPEVAGNQIWAVGRLIDLGDAKFCPKNISTKELKKGQAYCHDVAASYHLPKAAADFFLLRPSAGEGLLCNSSLRSKVFSDWLLSYIMATRPILEIFKMAGYFPDRPRICGSFVILCNLCALGDICEWL